MQDEVKWLRHDGKDLRVARMDLFLEDMEPDVVVLIESDVSVLKPLLQVSPGVAVVAQIPLGFVRQHLDIGLPVLFNVSMLFNQVSGEFSDVHEFDLGPCLRVEHLH